MKYNFLAKIVLFLTLFFLVLGGVNTPTALAGRYIFNQTPETLEKAFGSPVQTAECVPEPNRTPDSPNKQWCCFRIEENQGISRCVQSEKGQPLPVMHLYAPASFEKAFPDFPGSLFKISYINNKADRVSVEMSWSSSNKVFSYTPADAAKLFNYFFGYSAPVWFVYQEDFGIPPTLDYGVCLGDGVATSFTDYSGVVPYLDLFYRSECQARQYTFEDIKNHWARRFIENLSIHDIIAGYPDGTYRPDTTVTRAEMAALVSQAFTTSAKRQPIEFVDVPKDFWAYDAIQTAYQKGLMTGYPGGKFAPNQPISKVEAIVALSGQWSREPVNLDVLSFYQDAAKIPSYAKSAVAGATQNRVVVNYPQPNILNPNKPATRAEVAAVIYQTKYGRDRFISSPYIVTDR